MCKEEFLGQIVLCLLARCAEEMGRQNSGRSITGSAGLRRGVLPRVQWVG